MLFPLDKEVAWVKLVHNQHNSRLTCMKSYHQRCANCLTTVLIGFIFTRFDRQFNFRVCFRSESTTERFLQMQNSAQKKLLSKQIWCFKVSLNINDFLLICFPESLLSNDPEAMAVMLFVINFFFDFLLWFGNFLDCRFFITFWSIK